MSQLNSAMSSISVSMFAAMAALKPKALIPGAVVDKRALEGGATKTVFAYLLKVQAFGGMFEVTTKVKADYDAVDMGAEGVFECGFDSYNGALKLSLVKFVPSSGFVAGATEVKETVPPKVK